MDKNNVIFGIVFMGIGVFAWFVPSLGLLARGEAWDLRIAPVTFGIGLVFLIMGLMSKSDNAVPQPVQPQPPQQVVNTLVICPRCGSRVSAELKFCPECGTSLTPANPQPTYSDNRNVTTAYTSMPNSELTPPSPLWYILPLSLGLLGGILGYVLVKDRDREMAKRLLYVSIGMMFVWALFTYLQWMW